MITTASIHPEVNHLLDFQFVVEDPKTHQKEVLEFRHTKHSSKRAAQRGINLKKVSHALEYGESFFKQGLIYYILGEKNLPDHLTKDKKELQNLVVIVAGDSNQVITCYRSKKPFKHVKLKSKRLGISCAEA